MPVNGNAEIALVAYWSGNPTNVPMAELNIAFGTFVIDTSTPALWQKTSTTDNSTFNAIATGSGALTPSSIAATGNISSTGSILSSSPTAGVGYKTGAGGAVTQATNKSTGVTLNKVCGAITMNNAALATVTSVKFTLTNSAITIGDVLVVNHSSAGTSGAYLVGVSAVGAGSADIVVFNTTAGTLSEAIVLSFAVIQGVTA